MNAETLVHHRRLSLVTLKKIRKRTSDAARQRKTLEQFANRDYRWVVPLAKQVRDNADVIAKYLSEVFVQLTQNPISQAGLTDTRWILTKNIAKMLFPRADELLSQVERSLHSLELAIGEFSADILRDPDITREIIAPSIEILASAIEANPRLAVLLGQPELLRDTFGETGDRLAACLGVIPALSAKAAAGFPDLKEIFFGALFRLSESDRKQLYQLAENILREVYRGVVFPNLRTLLDTDPRGKVLAPILLGAIEAIPGESCLNAVLAIACTHQHQLTTGRIIAIAVQELGGLYVKISQVISELCPPSLARELRTSQDDAGGLFPSIETSWHYLLEQLNRAPLLEWLPYFDIPDTPKSHFASASIGALYELKLNAAGRVRFGVDSMLIKIQRPGLEGLLSGQHDHLLALCDRARDALVGDDSLTPDMRAELQGIVAAIGRAVTNYFRQSTSELDFTFEESNAARVRTALKGNDAIRIPGYFHSSPRLVLMERMPGTKVTKIVQTKYLRRREIADSIITAYLDLVFEKGVVWADPHPGNILYDDETNQVSMVDLNPCFVWDRKTREQFKHLLYRLLLRDASGVYSSLYNLVDSTDALHTNAIFDDLVRFLNAPLGTGSLTRFVGEFIRTLGENGIDLRIEVQAALRGLSQLALTANAISARNSFGPTLRRYFGLREMFAAAWEVGLMRVVRTLTSVLFDMTRQLPEEDVGPVLDERDINALIRRVRELGRAGVCDIRFSRVSPEDYSNLRLSADGSYLLVTSDLGIEILETRRPATVRYVVEIPTRRWLKDRQEFVKLASIARNFCIIESLEQLRRNSLDDYWRIVEAWNKSPQKRTVEETRLVGEVKTASRKLYALRFAAIWETSLAGLPKSARRIWKILMTVEYWREGAEQKYLTSIRQKFGHVILTNLAFSTFYRLKMLLIEAALWTLRRHIKALRYSMQLLPMNTHRLEDLVLFGLSRNVTSPKQIGR